MKGKKGSKRAEPAQVKKRASVMMWLPLKKCRDGGDEEVTPGKQRQQLVFATLTMEKKRGNSETGGAQAAHERE